MNDDVSALRPISQIASDLGIPREDLRLYGEEKAKVSIAHSYPRKEQGKLILVTAISPTPAGEGKTTTSIGLADGLRILGKRSVLALREPSMGPIFGIKGGAVGGGRSLLHPKEDINLHFTGDFAAITAANNLLAAAIDNHLHQGNTLGINPREITFRRALDMNDRALRNIVIGLGGRTGGVPRESGFDITAASEVMATFCMADSLEDLATRLGRICVARTFAGEPVYASDLKVDGAMAAILADAFAPNLVQTYEGTPAFVHGGPFANIAHGCNSIVATQAALNYGEYVVTEAGFGADLGAEKFLDLLCRTRGWNPATTVVVATVRALKYQAGVARADLGLENVDALRKGMNNLTRHVENMRDVFGQKVVVAINQFADDTQAEINTIISAMEAIGIKAIPSRHFAEGGWGAKDLAAEVVASSESETLAKFSYSESDSLEEKIAAVAKRVYHAGSVTYTNSARKELDRLEQEGWGSAGVCIAKTQYSFSTNPKALGAPSGHELVVREVRLSGGAGFVVALTGEIMTMPGLPKIPAAENISIRDGRVTGII